MCSGWPSSDARLLFVFRLGNQVAHVSEYFTRDVVFWLVPAQVACEALQVGDIVYVTENEEIPADLVLLKTSNTTGTVPHQMSYIETANIDGETNLKERMALPETAQLSIDALMNFTCVIECANPNKRIYQFDSTLHMSHGNNQNCVLSLSASQLLLQATYLRHTRYGHVRCWGAFSCCDRVYLQI